MTTFTAKRVVDLPVQHEMTIEAHPYFDVTKPRVRFVIEATSSDPSEAKRKVDEVIRDLFPNHADA